MLESKNLTIGLAGHGSGGHFYPLIAVGESIKSKRPDIELIYFGPTPFDQPSLDLIKAEYSKVIAGKNRNYSSILNIIDYFKIALGCVMAFLKLLAHYPDVIFSKGGYAAFPIVVAAKILSIPILMHDSDIVPGRVTTMTEKWARRVALSWPQAQDYITNPHTAVVGTPIRRDLITGSRAGGREFLDIPNEAVVILVLGGSQGAEMINNALITSLDKLLKDFYVIHQTGENNFSGVKQATDSLLNDEQKKHYLPFDNLNTAALSRAYGAADIVITRAGASGLFETAAVGQVPSIVIPITQSINDHQRKNAYAFQEAGAGIVIEENNLEGGIIYTTITNLLENKHKYQTMKEAARQFSGLDAADKIATELIQLANEH